MNLSIAYTNSSALRGRCEVTAARHTHHEPGYENGAVVPAGPWRAISAQEARTLRPTALTDDARLIELIKLPGHLPGALPQLADNLGDPNASYLGQAASSANALTTTENYTDGRRIGLHVDNWDKLSYTTKHQGRRRLCVNLGPGTRYLLVGATDIQSICRAMHQNPEQRYPHTDDLRAYVAARQPLLIYRLRLAPGEGYLAPTELLPHDGSTQDQPHPSAAAFWLGRWPCGVLPSLV
ncbi:hypothetical protein [Kitasatospora azatica]|uniref:hypothetical protein n=1 Tax=Kitasatospora azatica TaxID=58347 RepID=UPI000569374C|nr:hypothetical protein [Kitasatospora azatica]